MTQQPQAKYRHDYHAPDYQTTDIDLTFDLNTQKTVTTVVGQAIRHNTSDVPFHLNGEDLKLVSAYINDGPWTTWKEEEGVPVIGNLSEHFTLKIINEISPAANAMLKGLYQSDDALYTQCKAEGLHRITYYLDRPDVLVCFTIKIITDKTKYPFLPSGDNRIAQDELEDGYHWVRWQDPFPKPCYLFTLMTDGFDVLRGAFITHSGHEITLGLYVGRGNLGRASWIMTSLKDSMKWDGGRFGLEYGLDIYIIIAVDFFNVGVMEDKRLNIFNSKYVLTRINTATDEDYLDIERVIGREYFYNWAGSRVTYHNRFQLSLKENLTVFRDQEFSSDLSPRTINRTSSVRIMHKLQLAGDANPMAHPTRPDTVTEMNNFYTLTVYEKGMEMIRMIHTLLGGENFREGMQFYFERCDGSAATCDNFVRAIEDVSNVDLSHLHHQYSQPGTSVMTIKSGYNPETEQYTLTISQHAPAMPDQVEKQPLYIPLAIELYDNGGKVIPLQKGGHPVNSVLNVTQTEQTFVFDNICL